MCNIDYLRLELFYINIRNKIYPLELRYLINKHTYTLVHIYLYKTYNLKNVYKGFKNVLLITIMNVSTSILIASYKM